MKVGFIVSETWASAMATNLIKAGHDLQGFFNNRSPDKSARWFALGPRKATTVAGMPEVPGVVTNARGRRRRVPRSYLRLAV